MKAVKDDDRPALRYEGYDSMGYRTPILHVLTIDDARQLRDELTAVIKQCVIAEAVKHNSSNAQVERPTPRRFAPTPGSGPTGERP